jgi:hypothetical protein
VLALYKQDIIEAYEMARAAAAGIKLIAEIRTDLPAIKEKDFLDNFVEWNRSIVRQYNAFRRKDSEFEITVPIRSLTTLKTNYVDQMKEGGTGELIFDLADYFPSGMKFMRLRGVGLSYSTAAPEGPGTRYNDVSAVVVPPNTSDPFGAVPNDKTLPRLPVFVQTKIGDKTVPVRYSSSVNLYNVSPRGQWTILVSKKINTSTDNLSYKRNESLIANVQLHLLVVGQLSTSNSGFKDF